MVIWSSRALADLKQITRYLYVIDPEIAINTELTIIAKVNWLSTHTMAGSKIEGLGPEYKLGYAKGTTYKIYYKVISSNLIKVLLIRHGKQRNPTLREIKAAEKK